MKKPFVETMPEEIDRFVDSRLSDWIAVIRDLIRIPSPLGREHAILDYVEDHVRSLGLTPIAVPWDAQRLRDLPTAQPPISTISGRRNIVVHVPGIGGGRSLILQSHLDTVEVEDDAEWQHPPFSGYIDTAANIIYGRGAMDDKAGVVIALAVLETVIKLRPVLRGDVLFQFVLEEETTGNGSLLCLEDGHVADAAIILDGTRGEWAINGHAGNMQFSVEARGKPAAVCVSHMGVNAAEALAGLLLRLREAVLGLNEGREPPWARFPSPYQLVTQELSADAPEKTVPHLARGRCYVTFPPPFTIKTMRAFIEDQVQDFAHDPETASFRLDWNGLATEPVASSARELEEILQSCARPRREEAIEFGPSTGLSDMRHFVARDIPCLLCGPGAGFNPHREDEHYHLDDLPRMIGLFYDLTVSWCGRPFTDNSLTRV